MEPLDIIVGCEESQEVCMAYRELGHNAFSCDTLPCSGGHPEWHLQMDIFEALKLKKWHRGIFFPPCTRLTNSVIWYIKKNGLWQEVEQAATFFNALLNSGIPEIAVENPIQHGEARKYIEKPTQIIQPYNFNEDASKATCLWLRNLPKLVNTGYFPPRIVDGKNRWGNQTDGGQNKYPPDKKGHEGERARLRSKTFPGIAKAMANQWTAPVTGKIIFISTQLKLTY